MNVPVYGKRCRVFIYANEVSRVFFEFLQTITQKLQIFVTYCVGAVEHLRFHIYLLPIALVEVDIFFIFFSLHFFCHSFSLFRIIFGVFLVQFDFVTEKNSVSRSEEKQRESSKIRTMPETCPEFSVNAFTHSHGNEIFARSRSVIVIFLFSHIHKLFCLNTHIYIECGVKVDAHLKLCRH